MITRGYDPNDTSGSQIIMEYSQFGKELLDKEDKFEVSFADLFYMSGLAHYSNGQLLKAYRNFNKCISRKTYLEKATI